MDYWLKQTAKEPLFPELIWSRPENKHTRGKLAIIGGNSFGFASVAGAYQAAVVAGIGTARVLLPEAVKKVVGPVIAEGEFAPSNPSGSFGQKALADFLELSNWSDGVLVAGELGRNSETAILVDKFVIKYSGSITITKDAVDYFTSHPASILERPCTTLVLSLSQLQKLFIGAGWEKPITLSMDLIKLAETLHGFTSVHAVELVVKHLENIVVALGGQISTTKLDDDKPIWHVETAAKAAVWRLQNPDKPFEALTTSLL